MKVSAILGALVLVFVGATVFVVSQFASVDKDGVDFEVNEAEAKCTETPDCLPSIDFVDIHGQVYQPSDLAGKVVMFNFWATWCKPCLKEIPDFASAYTKYKDKGLVMLGILNDEVQQEAIERFAERTKMNFPVVRYDDAIMSAFEHPRMLPTTFVYGRDGRLHQRKQGALGEAELEQMLAALIAEPPPSVAPSK